MTSRYQGKPLLRLLECYVLDVIGELTPADRDNLERMSPKLQLVYKTQGNWRTIVSQIMHFPPSLDNDIRMLWGQHRALATQQGEEVVAEDFARRIVDENLAEG